MQRCCRRALNGTSPISRRTPAVLATDRRGGVEAPACWYGCPRRPRCHPCPCLGGPGGRRLSEPDQMSVGADLCACMMALIARLILRSQHLTLFSPLFLLASRGLLPSVVPLACLADRLLNKTLPFPPPCTTPYSQLFLLSLPFSSAASPLPPPFFTGHSCAGPCGSLAEYKQV